MLCFWYLLVSCLFYAAANKLLGMSMTFMNLKLEIYINWRSSSVLGKDVWNSLVSEKYLSSAESYFGMGIVAALSYCLKVPFMSSSSELKTIYPWLVCITPNPINLWKHSNSNINFQTTEKGSAQSEPCLIPEKKRIFEVMT